ncbi:MAG TPA: xanthine dehydrogenase family protein molybdopterin-binding subunit [Chloroflexota bacterium]|nr:xanthine dehydrogenase family protein molybdopterin-binding subunit [Chloroflexota bacterium]
MTTVDHPPPVGELGLARTRVEDLRLITGQGQYVEDITLPGTLWLAFVRSPYPHARIARIDTAAAAAAPGVVGVFTGQDFPAIHPIPLLPIVPNPRVPPYEPLAREVVRHVATPVAVVVAESRALAADAAQLVEVDYEPLPAVADAEAALADDAPVLWPEFGTNVCFQVRFRDGEPERMFAQAAHVVRLTLRFPRLAPVPMEPRAILAQYDKYTGELTAWVTTQSPTGTRDQLALALDLPQNRVRVIAPDVGGGFGARTPSYPEFIVAAHLARRLGRPCRAVNTRSEDVATTTHARDEVVRLEGAFDAEGRLLALRGRVVANLGAFLYTNSIVVPPRIAAMMPGCYRVEHADLESYAVFTNTNPTGPYRGAGRPEAADCIERLMDAAARQLGLDPVELRRRNFIRPDEFPHRIPTGPVYDSGNYEGALDKVMALSDYHALKRQQAEERARGERTLLGVGLATFVEPSAAGWESGFVRVEASGRVSAATGSSAHGQGHETTFAQILAHELQIPFEHIVVRHGDTATAPPGIGTFGSRSTVLGGTALVQAAQQVIAKAKRIAASLLEASPEDIELREGTFRVRGVGERAVSWAQVAAVAYGRGRLPPGETLGLEATAYYNAPRETFGFGAAVAVVRIDPDTGETHVEKLYCVDDCGTVINPLLVEGQIHGGTAQGLGQALLEQVIYEPDGTLLTGSLMHYALPRARTIPALVLAEQVTPSPLNPLGAKGVGESGVILGTAPIMNAVADALAPLGITHLDMPYTAERVWQAIQAARQQPSA